MKCRSFSFFRFDPDPATVPFDNLLANRKADSGAWILITRVQPLKDDEYPLVILLRDSNAVVAHGEMPDSGFLLRGDADLRRPFAPEFDRVADQVLQELA